MTLPKVARPRDPPVTAVAAPRREYLLVIMGAAASLMLLFGFTAYALRQSRDQYEDRALLLAQNLTSAVHDSLSANIEKIDIVLSSLVFHLEHQLESGPLDLVVARAQIRALASQNVELGGIRISDASGAALGSANADAELPKNFTFNDREWFRVQRERPDAGLYMSSPLFGRAVKLWYISFSRRYVDAKGNFAGVVTASVPISYFKRQLQALNVGPDGAVTLRHADLGLICRDRPDPRGPVAGDADEVGSRVVSPELLGVLARGTPKGDLRGGPVSFDPGYARVLSFRRLSVAPLIVTVGLGSRDYLADWRTEVRHAVFFCGAIFLLYAAGCVLLVRSMAQQRRVRQRNELLAKVFEHSGEAIILSDNEHRIIEINPAFTAQTGYSADEVIGQTQAMLSSTRSTAAEIAGIRDTVNRVGLWRGEVWNRTKDGREFPKWLSVSVLRNAQGAITHHIASSLELTHIKQAEARLQHMAHHDALTQLPNRIQLLMRLEQAMSMVRRAGDELAMLFIDMDRFKNINDTLGHQIGDGLLVEVAQRLRSLVRESDLVARLGGDEFVLVLTGIGRPGAAAAAQVAQKVIATLGQPYLVGGHELHSTPSIGISLFPGDGEDAETLMKNADTAMYKAKSAGRNNFQFFTPEMNETRAERLALEFGLRHAIDNGELLLHYQPQIDMASGKVVAVEALVRWQHPDMGMVPPLKFIPVAEDTGLIESIGTWVLEQALAQVARWRADGHPELRVAVNLSAHQLQFDSFADLVASALHRHGLPGPALELELTESVAMQDPARTALLLRELRAFGVALAIDDFGTGYSSLAYLKQLPLSCLKLDRSFVMDIDHDANDAAICTATIQMAHSLGLGVVAEGVETRTQLEFLRNLGCDIAQGYFFSRPLPVPECDLFLARQAEPASLDAAF